MRISQNHQTESLSVSTSPGYGVSSQTSIGIDRVPKIVALLTKGSHKSLTATAPIPHAVISGDGALTQRVYLYNGQTYYGYSLDLGAAFPQTKGLAIGYTHGDDYTYRITQFNIYDVIDNWCADVMRR